MQNELFESASVPKAYMKLALPVVLSMMVSSSILFWIRSLSLDWDRELRERRWRPLSEM